MNFSMISAPIIGAVIGYATNYIAIKMMFRPRKAVKIGRYTLPFTPGIIPKGQPRLAHAIGNVIKSSLLSKETLEETLLSDEMKEKLTKSLHETLVKMQDDERSIHDLITTYIDADSLDLYKANAIDYVAHRIDNHLQEYPVGEFVANEVIRTIKEQVKGGFLGLIAKDSLLTPIGIRIQQGIDDYLKENTISLVVPPITQECNKLLNTPLDVTVEKIACHEDAITEAILKVYEDLIRNHLDNIFNSVDIASIIELKINSMDVCELEDLVLSVMKKELNAIINLGALIGFILGLFNLLF